MRTTLRLLFATAFCSLLLPVDSALAQVTAFTYQGRLLDNGQPANGLYDLQFRLYDAPTNGAQVPIIPFVPNLPVSNGLFTTGMDFGSNIFNGATWWLEIAVQKNNSGFTTLSPRQPILPVPGAIFASSAGKLLGTLPAAQVTGSLPASQVTGIIPLSQLPAAVVTNGDARFNGTLAANNFSGNGSLLTNLNLAALSLPGTFELLNAGFTRAYDINSGGHPRSVVLADLNGDGRLDLISGHSGLQIALNNGAGFGNFTNSGVDDARQIVVADINGDAKPDVVYAAYFVFGMIIESATNGGNGTLYYNGNLSLSEANNPVSTLAVGDMNGDGKPDLIVPYHSDFAINIDTNNGSGNFRNWYAVTNNLLADGTIQFLTAADVNNDGKSDVIVALSGNVTGLLVFTNGANGLVLSYTNKVVLGALQVLVADVNGDTLPDLIAGTPTGISILLNNGNGAFSVSSTINLSVTDWNMTTGDVNGDGRVDLVVGDPSVGSVRFYANNGAGVFSPFAAVPAGAGTRGVAVGDVNNDGLNDVIAANLDASTLSVLPQVRAVSGTFMGDGSRLSSLSASALTGIVADTNLSGNIALRNASQTFSGVNTMSNAANTFAGNFSGNGAGLTNVPLTALLTAPITNNQTGVTLGGTFSGNGNGLTNLNAASLTSTVADARLSGNVALLNGTNIFTATNRFTGVAIVTNVNNQFAGAFTGNGNGLTNLNAANLVSSIADARLSANVPLLNGANVFSGANRFSGVATVTNANNQFAGTFTGSGSGLTSLPAANLSGTILQANLGTVTTFTPTVGNGTANFTTSVQQGYYSKIGNLVYFEVWVTWTAKGSVTSGDLTLPLPVPSVSGRPAFQVGYVAGLTFNTQLTAIPISASTFGLCDLSKTGFGGSLLPITSCGPAGEIQISGTYRWQ